MITNGISNGAPILEKYGYVAGLDGQGQEDGNDLFLNLLMTQLRNQDPLQPLENGEFTNQLTSLAEIEQSQALNKSLSNLIALQEVVAGQNAFTQSASLVGKNVEFADPESGELKQGVVDSVHLLNGSLVLDIGGVQVQMNQVSGILNSDSP